MQAALLAENCLLILIFLIRLQFQPCNGGYSQATDSSPMSAVLTVDTIVHICIPAAVDGAEWGSCPLVFL